MKRHTRTQRSENLEAASRIASALSRIDKLRASLRDAFEGLSFEIDNYDTPDAVRSDFHLALGRMQS